MIKIIFHFSIRIYSNGKKKAYVGTPRVASPVLLKTLIERTLHQFETSRGRSTNDNYRTAVRSFMAYAGQKLFIADVTPQLMEGWQQWLRSHNVSPNTVSCYMRSLRSVLRHAGLSDVDSLFKGVFTGVARTVKRAISVDDINRLQNLVLTNKPALQLSRDIFLFSVYALGMPLVDVAFLRKQQFCDGYINYQRHKNGQSIRICIEPVMLQIINRYATSASSSPYLFPILKRGTMEEYHAFRSKYNRHLGQLAVLAQIEHCLTSYVARHSWASLAYHANVGLPVISKALGHTSSQTTQVYIREIDDRRVDVANHAVIMQLLNHPVNKT